jgi:hypothetical protein
MRIEAQDIHDSTIYLTYNIAVYYHQKKLLHKTGDENKNIVFAKLQ